MQLLTELMTLKSGKGQKQRSAIETSDSKTESVERLETIHVLNALYFPSFIFSSSEQYAAEYH